MGETFSVICGDDAVDSGLGHRILHLHVLDHATTVIECDFDDELHW
jgi:hypothetical protein